MDRPSRRRFLKQFAAAMGYAALGGPLPLMRRLELAMATELAPPLASRRHLITVLAPGASGFDAHSFHMSFNPASMDPANQVTIATASATPTGEQWSSRRALAADGSVFDHFPHPKYAPSEDVFLGPGMSIFQGTGLLENDLLVWGGAIWKDGGHTIGSEVLACGQRSRYAIGFGSHIAKHLAKAGALPLHYVQLAAPDSLPTHTGMLGGMGEPISIVDPTTWQNLTVPKPYAIAGDARSRLDASVGRLGAIAAARFAHDTSRAAFDDYLAAFRATGLVGGSGWGAAGSPFDQLWQSYRAEAKAEVQAHAFWNRYVTLSGSTNFPSVKDAGSGLLDLDRLTFRFALAEFLVGENLSAVVELPGMFLDAHSLNDQEAVSILATFSCFKKLLLGLKSYKSKLNPQAEPVNVLSRTTAAMFTEFDRMATLSYESGANGRPGTDHGVTGSVILAGKGVRGGSVVGGLKHGDGRGAYGSFPGIPGAGLPVDLRAGAGYGRPLLDGTKLYFESLFPTMMKAFGVPVPERQITADSALDVLLKLDDLA